MLLEIPLETLLTIPPTPPTPPIPPIPPPPPPPIPPNIPPPIVLPKGTLLTNPLFLLLLPPPNPQNIGECCTFPGRTTGCDDFTESFLLLLTFSLLLLLVLWFEDSESFIPRNMIKMSGTDNFRYEKSICNTLHYHSSLERFIQLSWIT